MDGDLLDYFAKSSNRRVLVRAALYVYVVESVRCVFDGHGDAWRDDSEWKRISGDSYIRGRHTTVI